MRRIAQGTLNSRAVQRSYLIIGNQHDSAALCGGEPDCGITNQAAADVNIIAAIVGNRSEIDPKCVQNIRHAQKFSVIG